MENPRFLCSLADCHGPQWGVMVTCSRLLPFWILRFTGSELTQFSQLLSSGAHGHLQGEQLQQEWSLSFLFLGSFLNINPKKGLTIRRGGHLSLRHTFVQNTYLHQALWRSWGRERDSGPRSQALGLAIKQERQYTSCVEGMASSWQCCWSVHVAITCMDEFIDEIVPGWAFRRWGLVGGKCHWEQAWRYICVCSWCLLGQVPWVHSWSHDVLHSASSHPETPEPGDFGQKPWPKIFSPLFFSDFFFFFFFSFFFFFFFLCFIFRVLIYINGLDGKQFVYQYGPENHLSLPPRAGIKGMCHHYPARLFFFLSQLSTVNLIHC